MNDFERTISEGIVLVDFYASWCGPCRMLGPVIEDLQRDLSDLKIIKIDVDENQDLAMKYSVMSIPTLILFKDGNVIDKHQGFLPKEEIIEWINKNK